MAEVKKVRAPRASKRKANRSSANKNKRTGVRKHKVGEGEIQSACLKLLLSYGIACKRINTTGIPDGRGGFRENPAKGFFDIVACVKGLFVGIECKSKTGVQSKEQKECQAEFILSGGIAIVARHPRDVYELLIKLEVVNANIL